jgi:hypothetical protein
MNKHTPGPWKTHGNIIEGTDDETIAYVTTYNTLTPKQKANVRLIAAAPDLLAALQGLLRGIFDGPDEANAAMLIAKARDAVNKATGEK